MVNDSNRAAFIDDVLKRTIKKNRPMTAIFVPKEAYQNFCNVFREVKLEEAEHIPNWCLEKWAINLKEEFNRATQAIEFSHILDGMDSVSAKKDIAKREKRISSSEQD